MTTITRVFEFDTALVPFIEEWRVVEGYPNYIVSNKGEVRSLAHRVKSKHKTRRQRGQILKPSENMEGYLYVMLHNEKGCKRFRVNRLVAQTFIPNKEGLPCVNHRNYVRSDNRVENLEWCTASYNLVYSRVAEISAEATSIKVAQMDTKGNTIKIWDSISSAARDTGVCSGNISCCCRGKRITAGNYKWTYI